MPKIEVKWDADAEMPAIHLEGFKSPMFAVAVLRMAIDGLEQTIRNANAMQMKAKVEQAQNEQRIRQALKIWATPSLNESRVVVRGE